MCNIIHIIQRNVENTQQTMKGKITKSDEGWMISRCVGDGVAEVWEELLPLHPDDVRQINADAQVFDNIEARIAAYPDVEFDWCVIIGPDGKGFECAKLKQNNA